MCEEYSWSDEDDADVCSTCSEYQQLIAKTSARIIAIEKQGGFSPDPGSRKQLEGLRARLRNFVEMQMHHQRTHER